MWPNKNDVLDQLYKYTLATKNLGKNGERRRKKNYQMTRVIQYKTIYMECLKHYINFVQAKNSSNICKNLIQELNVGEYSLGNIEEWQKLKNQSKQQKNKREENFFKLTEYSKEIIILSKQTSK